jgi:hypothetical protein
VRENKVDVRVSVFVELRHIQTKQVEKNKTAECFFSFPSINRTSSVSTRFQLPSMIIKVLMCKMKRTGPCNDSANKAHAIIKAMAIFEITRMTFGFYGVCEVGYSCEYRRFCIKSSTKTRVVLVRSRIQRNKMGE